MPCAVGHARKPNGPDHQRASRLAEERLLRAERGEWTPLLEEYAVERPLCDMRVSDPSPDAFVIHVAGEAARQQATRQMDACEL